MSLPDTRADNARAYDTVKAQQAFVARAKEGLWPMERECVDLLSETRRRTILDIGIGAGRTCEALSGMFEEYLGADYSPAMIEAARRHFPSLDLRVMDARRIDDQGRFDCVMFSYNGIDYVDYQDRRKVLQAFHRALKDDGLLIYSTHNVRFRRRKVWQENFWVREMLRLRGGPRNLLNRLRNYSKQRTDPQDRFRLVNDPGMAFTLMTVYVDLGKEVQVLSELGFRVEKMIGNTRSARPDSEDDIWVYIAARKARLAVPVGS